MCCDHDFDDDFDYDDFCEDCYDEGYEEGCRAGRSSSRGSCHSPSASSSGGCYVATCVYGSYDCPQVWTLRRFRDSTLAKSVGGRAFIRTYYAVSPTLVRWFGDTVWFRKLWRSPLDRLVKKLQNDGVENTPYRDRDW